MKKTHLVATAIIVAVGFLLAATIPRTVTPKFSKTSYNESEAPANWVGREEKLRADFGGHFYVIVNRNFDRIIVWVTPREGARTTYIRVEITRKFLNGLYLEVEPPWYGDVEIKRGDAKSGMKYLIEVKNLGEAGKSTYKLEFIDRAPEKELTLRIYVEVRDGLFRYRGEVPVLILEPYGSETH